MRIRSIDALRGIAAIAVVFRHFSYPHADLKAFGQYGSYGVQVFFVISGFILPYSLHKSGYTLPDFWRFLLKRVTRLDPPYFTAAVFALTLTVLNGRGLLSMTAMFAHVGYLNEILGLDWASGVFWTLAIEFQFYLFLALTFDIFFRSRFGLALLFATVIIGGVVLRNPAFLPNWLPFFALGILLHKFKIKEISRTILIISLGTMFCLAGFLHPIAALLAGGFAVLFILFVNIDQNTLVERGILWLGMISYSLYLTHNEWGKIAIRIVQLFIPAGASALFVVVFQMIFAILCSYAFYLLFERPFQKISARISYKSAKNKFQP